MTSSSNIPPGGPKRSHEEVESHLREMSKGQTQAQEQMSFQSLISTISQKDISGGNAGHTSSLTPKVGQSAQQIEQVARSVSQIDTAQVMMDATHVDEQKLEEKQKTAEGHTQSAKITQRSGSAATPGAPTSEAKSNSLSVPVTTILP